MAAACWAEGCLAPGSLDNPDLFRVDAGAEDGSKASAGGHANVAGSGTGNRAGMGGADASIGMGTGDSPGADGGGTTGSGGASGNGGATDSGGATSSGGTTSGNGGATSSGGTTNGNGGATSSGGKTNGGGSGNGGATSSGGTTSSGGATSSGGTNATGGGGSTSTGSVVYVEAESGSVTDPMTVSMDANASGGKYVSVPSGSANADPSASTMGIDTIPLTIANSGSYFAFGRIIAPSSASDSFWVKMDGGAWMKWSNLTPGAQWVWNDVHDSMQSDMRVSYTLDAGMHTLNIAYRDPGAQLDKLVFATDSAFVPTGVGQ